MNCIDVRRQLLTDPSSKATALREHVQSCTACREFVEGLADFEQALDSSLSVPVPEGLSSRILLRQRLAVQQSRRRAQWLAMAASLLLVLGVVLVQLDFAQPELDTIVLSHINDELHHLSDRHNVDMERLNKLLQPHGAQVAGLNRPVHYAGACPMRRHDGAHLVVGGSNGPVTILIMPGEYVEKRSSLKDERFQGVIIPTENGSMAIVGEDPQQVEEVEQELQRSLRFLS